MQPKFGWNRPSKWRRWWCHWRWWTVIVNWLWLSISIISKIARSVLSGTLKLNLINQLCLFVCMFCSVGQALVYHLSDIKGMSMWPDKFGAVGLSEQAAQEAVRVAGSFMLKARELQQLVVVSSAGNRHTVLLFSARNICTEFWHNSLFCQLHFFWFLVYFSFSALTLLFGHQEEQPTCRNWVMRYWCVWSNNWRGRNINVVVITWHVQNLVHCHFLNCMLLT